MGAGQIFKSHQQNCLLFGKGFGSSPDFKSHQQNCLLFGKGFRRRPDFQITSTKLPSFWEMFWEQPRFSNHINKTAFFLGKVLGAGQIFKSHQLNCLLFGKGFGSRPDFQITSTKLPSFWERFWEQARFSNHINKTAFFLGKVLGAGQIFKSHQLNCLLFGKGFGSRPGFRITSTKLPSFWERFWEQARFSNHINKTAFFLGKVLGAGQIFKSHQQNCPLLLFAKILPPHNSDSSNFQVAVLNLGYFCKSFRSL